jgi:hypothetical protein
MMDKEYDDEKNATLKLKKCLFEICKTNFDRSSALDQLIIKHSPLVVDVFGDNPFDVMPELLDFYDYNDYENPENGECRSFADWSEYFCKLPRKELTQIIFDLMKKRASVENMLATILNGHRQLADQFSISDINQLNDFLEDNEYMDDVLEIEQSLSDWILFFDNDEFCLYNACVNLTEQNKHLLKKLDDIQSIIEHG